jgi:hypothetical protein
VEQRGVANSYQQPLWAQQTCSDLAPWLRPGVVDKPIALFSELGSCGSDIGHFELDAGLGCGDIDWPFGGVEAGVCSFREWPQPEVLRPLDRKSVV